MKTHRLLSNWAEWKVGVFNSVHTSVAPLVTRVSNSGLFEPVAYEIFNSFKINWSSGFLMSLQTMAICFCGSVVGLHWFAAFVIWNSFSSPWGVKSSSILDMSLLKGDDWSDLAFFRQGVFCSDVMVKRLLRSSAPDLTGVTSAGDIVPFDVFEESFVSLAENADVCNDPLDWSDCKDGTTSMAALTSAREVISFSFDRKTNHNWCLSATNLRLQLLVDGNTIEQQFLYGTSFPCMRQMRWERRLVEKVRWNIEPEVNEGGTILIIVLTWLRRWGEEEVVEWRERIFDACVSSTVLLTTERLEMIFLIEGKTATSITCEMFRFFRSLKMCAPSFTFSAVTISTQSCCQWCFLQEIDTSWAWIREWLLRVQGNLKDWIGPNPMRIEKFWQQGNNCVLLSQRKLCGEFSFVSFLSDVARGSEAQGRSKPSKPLRSGRFSAKRREMRAKCFGRMVANVKTGHWHKLFNQIVVDALQNKTKNR